MAKQTAFMNGIASKLQRSRMTSAPVHPFRGSPDFWKEFNWSAEQRVEQFISNFRSVGGHAEHLSDMDAVRQFIVEKAHEMSAKHILLQNEPELNELRLEPELAEANVRVWNSNEQDNWKERAAQADFGIVMADYAAAYTGSVAVLSSEQKGRSVSLLPTALFVLIPIERLRTRLGEILINFDQARREQLPAGIHFISGPSRSADIENDLTIGVHGPGIVFALIIG